MFDIPVSPISRWLQHRPHKSLASLSGRLTPVSANPLEACLINPVFDDNRYRDRFLWWISGDDEDRKSI